MTNICMTAVTLITRVTQAAAILAAAMLVTVLLVTNHMMAVRLLGEPIVWHVELSIYLTIAAFFIGAPYVAFTKGDVAVDILIESVSRDTARVVHAIILAITLVVCAYLAYAGWERTMEAFSSGARSTSLWGPRLWPVYACMPIGLALTAIQAAAEICRIILNPAHGA